MKIGIASDHRGIQMKTRLTQLLQSLDCEVHDFGPQESQSVDYPDYAAQVSREVSNGSIDRGILICGTGIGMCITANKFTGVRAAPCHDSVTAEYSRLHNDSNVICLSADQLSDGPCLVLIGQALGKCAQRLNAFDQYANSIRCNSAAC